jgi:hypothetical protein
MLTNNHLPLATPCRTKETLQRVVLGGFAESTSALQEKPDLEDCA